MNFIDSSNPWIQYFCVFKITISTIIQAFYLVLHPNLNHFLYILQRNWYINRLSISERTDYLTIVRYIDNDKTIFALL